MFLQKKKKKIQRRISNFVGKWYFCKTFSFDRLRLLHGFSDFFIDESKLCTPKLLRFELFKSQFNSKFLKIPVEKTFLENYSKEGRFH